MGTNSRTMLLTRNGTEEEIGKSGSRKRARKIYKKGKDQENEAGTNTAVVVETRTELGRRL